MIGIFYKNWIKCTLPFIILALAVTIICTVVIILNSVKHLSNTEDFKLNEMMQISIFDIRKTTAVFTGSLENEDSIRYSYRVYDNSLHQGRMPKSELKNAKSSQVINIYYAKNYPDISVECGAYEQAIRYNIYLILSIIVDIVLILILPITAYNLPWVASLTPTCKKFTMIIKGVDYIDSLHPGLEATLLRAFRPTKLILGVEGDPNYIIQSHPLYKHRLTGTNNIEIDKPITAYISNNGQLCIADF